MAAPVKRRTADENKKYILDDSESSSDENSDGKETEAYIGPKEIQVDFEGRNPTDSDFHGIKQLLQQLFLKAHINLTELTELIISQNYVGSVVKQSEVDDDSDDECDGNDVFGITSVVNLTEKQNVECIQQLRHLLLELSREHASDSVNTLVLSLLDAQPVGLLISERFINIPAQIAVPLLDSLSKEMKRAQEKKMPFEFNYFIIISKLYKVDSTLAKKKSKKKRQQKESETELYWSNPEEEIFNEEAEGYFEFCVKADSDSGLGGQWLEDDIQMVPYRRVLIVQARKLDDIISKIRSSLQ